MSAATLETQSAYMAGQVSGERALEVFDRHRGAVGERFYTSELATEFPTLARELGNLAVYIAGCDTSKAGAFKVRGMLVEMHESTDPSMSIVIPSAGNAARGAVVAAHHLGRSLTTVVPVTAPPEKKEGLQVLKSELLSDGTSSLARSDNSLTVIAHGNTFDESLQFAGHIQRHTGAYLLHPYDSPGVIAGQGTIINDLNRHMPDFDTIVTPTGGGGLLAGLVSRLQELNQDARVYAVEADGNNSMSRSLRAGRVVEARQPNQRYGGSAVRKCGEVCLNLLLDAKYRADNVINVDDAEVAQVAGDYLNDRSERLVTTDGYEPTSLVALAGLRKLARDGRLGKKTIVLGTGHNAPIESLFAMSPLRRCHVASGPMER